MAMIVAYGSGSLERRHAYVLAVACTERIWMDGPPGLTQVAAQKVITEQPVETWQRLSCGQGSKGSREYDWTWVELVSPLPTGWGRWLLARRSLDDPTQLAYFMVFAPNGTSISEVVQVAGMRWSIKMGFAVTKDELGLDHYEVRSAASLVSTCHTSAVGTRHIGHSLPSAGYGRSIGGSNEPKLLSWTLPEVQRLIWRLIWSTPPSLAAVCHWSFWRRRKQERARQCHYRRHAQRVRPSGQVLSVGKPNRQSYPTNLSDQQWADAQRVIPIHRVGRPCKIDLRYCSQCLLLHASQPLFLANAAQGVPKLANRVFLPVPLASAGSLGEHL